MSNSNLIIPTSDDSESSLSDSSDERPFKSKNRKLILEKKAMINQCTACAGYHDLSDCVNRRGNQKYLHYENVRNKFAKDVGFNYRRGGGDSHNYNYNNSRDDPRQHKRDRYDDRRIEYHRGGGDKLRWDDHRNGGGDHYGGKRSKRDTDNLNYYEENKKRMKYSENSNSNSSSLGELLKFSKSNKHYSSRVANDPRLKN